MVMNMKKGKIICLIAIAVIVNSITVLATNTNNISDTDSPLYAVRTGNSAKLNEKIEVKSEYIGNDKPSDDFVSPEIGKDNGENGDGCSETYESECNEPDTCSDVPECTGPTFCGDTCPWTDCPSSSGGFWCKALKFFKAAAEFFDPEGGGGGMVTWNPNDGCTYSGGFCR